MSREDISKLNGPNQEMAWNEPGGNGSNGSKDPWGNKGRKQDGPPDLDEVFKKLNEKVTSLFGGKGGKSGGGSAQGGAKGLGFVAVILLVLWVLSGIYIVTDGTHCLEYILLPMVRKGLYCSLVNLTKPPIQAHIGIRVLFKVSILLR